MRVAELLSLKGRLKMIDSLLFRLKADIPGILTDSIDDVEQKLLIAQARIQIEVTQRPSQLADELDRSSADSDLNACLGMYEWYLNRKRALANSGAEILTRIKEGSFGECAHCEEAIPLERLEAQPTSSLCLKCQSSTERLLNSEAFQSNFDRFEAFEYEAALAGGDVFL